jgi:hypothetical protein
MKLTGFDTACTDCAHGGKVREAGGEKHISSSFFERLQAAEGVLQAGRSGVKKIVRSRRQDKGKLECTCRLRGGSDSFDSQAKIVKGSLWLASRILDRASHEPRLGCQPDRFRHDCRRIAKPSFEIRRYGQIRGIDNQARVR